MKRARFLIAILAAACAQATAPRLASAAAAGRVRIVRRYGRAPVPGRCANHRASRRWSGFTAADFEDRVR